MPLVLRDRTPENEWRIVEAVCEVIRALGFKAMARQFRDEPERRKEIALLIGHQISKRLGLAKGARFVDLAMLVVPQDQTEQGG